MSEPAWLIKTRAREAIQQGRPDLAHELFNQLEAMGHRKAFALREDVVRGYQERAERSVSDDDWDSAWADLQCMEELAPKDGRCRGLRETLVRLALAEIRALLETGKPLPALKAAVQLRERPATSPELAPLEEAAQDWVLAEEIADRGDFVLARSAVGRVRNRLGEVTAGLDRFDHALERRADRFRHASDDLQQSLESKHWRGILRAAEKVLEAAPQHREAQQAKNRAWQVLQPDTTQYRQIPVAAPDDQSIVSDSRGMRQGRGGESEQPTGGIGSSTIPKRFFLWIDGVGGFLVCTVARVTIGQASTEGGPVDVPLFADISRIHASIYRDDECYMLESSREVLVNNQSHGRVVLSHHDRITIGGSCQMLFEQPVPGCLSARLTLNGRRLPFAVDGVLLMADMLILGPGEKSHVRMDDLQQPITLFRQKDRLALRCPGELVIEGQKQQDRSLLPHQGSVQGEGFSFAIEPFAGK